MKISCTYLLISSIILMFPLGALAEFSCKTEVLYRWKAISGEVGNGEKSPEEEVIEESWAKIERKGASEAEAKKTLQSEVKRKAAEAAEACKRERENLAGCISGKYESMKDVVNQMSFTARRSLEEAMAEDCKQSLGKCLGTTIKEVECVEHKVEEVEEKSGKKADSKKAKKDKKAKKK